MYSIENSHRVYMYVLYVLFTCTVLFTVDVKCFYA